MKNRLLSTIGTHSMLLLAVFFWGTNPMMMKIGLRGLDPFPFTTLRLFVGICIATPIVLLSRNWKPIQRADISGLFMIPALGFIVFQFFFTVGVGMSTASVTAVVLAILPIAVAIIGHAVGTERLTTLKIIGVITTVLGVVAIALGTPNGIGVRGTQILGVALLVLCEIGFGVYTVFLKPLSAKYPVPQITVLVMIGAFVPFAIYTLIQYGPSVYADIETSTWFSALYSGILALVTANILWTMGIKKLDSVRTSVYGNLQPVFGISAGVIILGEKLSMIQIIGALVVLAGILLVNRKQIQSVKTTL